ncbi:MAG: SMI1/KNR4 family protein [Bacteroidota bacterium]
MSNTEQYTRRLLEQTDLRFRIFDKPTPTEAELANLEQRHGLSFPPDYRAFVLSDGHNYGEFGMDILAPSQALAEQARLGDHLLPFAENSCGDWYCWLVDDLPNAPVVWWDHETETTSDYADSFMTCLEQWMSS